MKSPIPAILAVFTLSSLTSADLSDIPACAFPCIISAVSSTGLCDVTDFVCQCQPANRIAIGQAAAPCVIAACGAEVNNVLTAANTACEVVLSPASDPHSSFTPKPTATSTLSSTSVQEESSSLSDVPTSESTATLLSTSTPEASVSLSAAPTSESTASLTAIPTSESTSVMYPYPSHPAPSTTTTTIQLSEVPVPTSTLSVGTVSMSVSTAAGNGTATRTGGIVQASAGAGVKGKAFELGGFVAVGMAVLAAF